MALARQNHYDAYKNTEISTANQGKLIVMLYEGAVRFLHIARDNMSYKTYDVVNTNIIKAQDILTELMLSLDMGAGGEIAQNLFNLYAYMKKRLIESNINKDREGVDEVIRYLEQLRGAWEEIALKEAAAPGAVRRTSPGREQGVSFSIQG